MMYEYKLKDVIDVADFEEIAPKIGTVILADARQLIFMATRLLVMEFNSWRPCEKSTRTLSHTLSLGFLLEEPC